MKHSGGFHSVFLNECFWVRTFWYVEFKIDVVPVSINNNKETCTFFMRWYAFENPSSLKCEPTKNVLSPPKHCPFVAYVSKRLRKLRTFFSSYIYLICFYPDIFYSIITLNNIVDRCSLLIKNFKKLNVTAIFSPFVDQSRKWKELVSNEDRNKRKRKKPKFNWNFFCYRESLLCPQIRSTPAFLYIPCIHILPGISLGKGNNIYD